MEYSQAREVHIEGECNSLHLPLKTAVFKIGYQTWLLLNKDFYLPIQSPPTTRL